GEEKPVDPDHGGRREGEAADQRLAPGKTSLQGGRRFFFALGARARNSLRFPPSMRRLLPAALLPLLIALAGTLGAALPFPQSESDLHADPAARFGTLPNGLRYVVMANHE